MEKDDKLLAALIEDKARQCEDQYIETHTAFLDLREQSLALGTVRTLGSACPRHRFCGGYEEAERRILVFMPDYEEEPDPSVLSVLRVRSAKGSKPLTHRDYLGSLLALGIKREVTGDIIVSENGADIIVLSDMAEFLLSNYSKAGHVNLSAQIVGIGELDTGTIRIEKITDTVASVRLDSVLASAFSLPRSRAQEAVARGIVFVNDREAHKPDAELSEGDKIVLRGKGKCVLAEIGGRTRKDRVRIAINRYL